MNVKRIKPLLSADVLKLIAILTMLVDHIAYRFIPRTNEIYPYLRLIGKTTAPIMFFFIAEGFSKTTDVKRYLKRLALFTIISYPAFVFFKTGKFIIDKSTGSWHIIKSQSVIYTLLLGLIALIVISNEKYNIVVKVIGVIVLSILSIIGDWGLWGVLWIVAFYIFRESYVKQCIGFTAVFVARCMYYLLIRDVPIKSLSQFLGMFIALFLIGLYNGKRNSKTKLSKWFFYIFYPLHLTILGIIAVMV